MSREMALANLNDMVCITEGGPMLYEGFYCFCSALLYMYLTVKVLTICVLFLMKVFRKFVIYFYFQLLIVFIEVSYRFLL